MELAWKKLTQTARRAYASARKKEPRSSGSRANIWCQTQRDIQVRVRTRTDAGAWSRYIPRNPTTINIGVCRLEAAGGRSIHRPGVTERGR